MTVGGEEARPCSVKEVFRQFATNFRSKECADSSCTACPEGQYQDEVGTTNMKVPVEGCKSCEEGSYVNEGKCEVCDGRISAHSCITCAAGKYAACATDGPCDNCVDCPTGFFSESKGLSECSNCMDVKTDDALYVVHAHAYASVSLTSLTFSTRPIDYSYLLCR